MTDLALTAAAAIGATLVVLTVLLGMLVWAGRGSRPTATPAPKVGDRGDPLDHERRLLVCEAKGRALEMEWEDTRAKFLGMTRSFIRQAKLAGLTETPSGPVAIAGPGTGTRRDVLQKWRSTNAQP